MSAPALQQKTFTIQYEVNDACNLRCTHCYQGTKAIRESTVPLERLFEQIEELRASLGEEYQIVIRLTGGESFLRVDLFETLMKILCQGYVTVLLTNGTLVQAENARQVLLHGVALTQVSLDGPSSVLHDKIRGSGQFEKALQGIRHLAATGEPVGVNYTLMQDWNDFPEHIEALFQLAQRENIFKVSFSRMFPQGLGMQATQYAYTDGPKYKRVLENLLDIAKLYPGLQIVLKDPLVRNLEREIPSHIQLDVCCYIKKDYISVAVDGSVYACRKLGKPVGNLHSESLAHIWQQGTLLQQLADRKHSMTGKCQSCPIQDSCQGGCLAASYGSSGQLFVPDPACWREEKKIKVGPRVL